MSAARPVRFDERTLSVSVQTRGKLARFPVALVGEPTYRVWRLYMSAAAHAFRRGRIGVIQSLFAKADVRGGVDLPMTRADLDR